MSKVVVQFILDFGRRLYNEEVESARRAFLQSIVIFSILLVALFCTYIIEFIKTLCTIDYIFVLFVLLSFLFITWACGIIWICLVSHVLLMMITAVGLPLYKILQFHGQPWAILPLLMLILSNSALQYWLRESLGQYASVTRITFDIMVRLSLVLSGDTLLTIGNIRRFILWMLHTSLLIEMARMRNWVLLGCQWLINGPSMTWVQLVDWFGEVAPKISTVSRLVQIPSCLFASLLCIAKGFIYTGFLIYLMWKKELVHFDDLFILVVVGICGMTDVAFLWYMLNDSPSRRLYFFTGNSCLLSTPGMFVDAPWMAEQKLKEGIKKLFGHECHPQTKQVIDLFVVFVGCKGTGKTSVLNALTPTGQRSGCTTKRNSSVPWKESNIIRWNFIDTPPWEVSNFKHQDWELMNVAVVVWNGSINDSCKKLYDAALKQVGGYKERVLIVLNKCDEFEHTNTGLSEVQQQMAECLNTRIDFILPTCTLKIHSKSGIEELKKMINDVLNVNEEKILHEMKQPSSILPEMIAMSAATIAVWVPGMTTWGSLAGPVLLTMGTVGAVATVPLAVVVGTGMLVRGGRKLTWWLNRPKNPSD